MLAPPNAFDETEEQQVTLDIAHIFIVVQNTQNVLMARLSGCAARLESSN